MQWSCPKCGVTYSWRVDDPPGNKVVCNGCGHTVTLTPGKLSEADLKEIERVKQEVRANPELADILSASAATRDRYWSDRLGGTGDSKKLAERRALAMTGNFDEGYD